MPVKKTITIGRAPDNLIIINNTALSEHHAKIEVYDNDEIFISELDYVGLIWVNGINVKRKLVSKDCDINICGTHIDLRKVIKPSIVDISEQRVPKEIEEKFMELKKIYDEYIENRKKHIKTQTFSSLITIPIFLIPFVGFGVAQAARSLISNPMRLQIIEEEFRLKYKCVYIECSMLWGNTPWENINMRKTCPYCKKPLCK